MLDVSEPAPLTCFAHICVYLSVYGGGDCNACSRGGVHACFIGVYCDWQSFSYCVVFASVLLYATLAEAEQDWFGATGIDMICV